MKIFAYTLHTPRISIPDRERNQTELISLITTHGDMEITSIIQKRWVPDYHYFLHTWKLDEIRTDMLNTWATLLLINNILKPQQIFQLIKYFEKDSIQVWDRVDLILKIFEHHATTMESRLQIELAAIKHMWPRIFGMGMELSRQWSGTNARGLWETNTEIMKRHLKEKERLIKRKLEGYANNRALHRYARRRHNIPVIWLVWYTNAWKSSLFTALSHKAVEREDKLFATLGTHFGMYYDTSTVPLTRFLINDTIWFIDDLPPDLIEAFHSTLDESVHADVLLHIVDSSDEYRERKIKIVEDILIQIQPTGYQQIVFTKTDISPYLDQIKDRYPEALYVSSITKDWLTDIVQCITTNIHVYDLPNT